MDEYKALKNVGRIFLLIGVMAAGLGLLASVTSAISRSGSASDAGLWIGGGLMFLLLGAVADLLVGVARDIKGLHHAVERLAERAASM